ncbi:MAG: hypothetical protein H0T86_00310 [Gemmatimonadales bacterium]|nr:hypothetical protein [Gemmatimonadales bacterium]
MEVAEHLIAAGELRDRFASLVRRLGGSRDPAAAADALLAAWAEPGRTYHGTTHLVDCLARLDELVGGPGDHDAIETALWYHDGVYDPRASDNEERSAAGAERALIELGIAHRVAGEVGRLIRLTRHTAPPNDEAGRVVCDIDLSILGRRTAEFDAYDAAIREEYAWLEEETYRAGRRRILAAILARESIYETVTFKERYEAPARANLRRALARLEALR